MNRSHILGPLRTPGSHFTLHLQNAPRYETVLLPVHACLQWRWYERIAIATARLTAAAPMGLRKMNSIVLDASSALALVLPDESSQQIHSIVSDIDPRTTSIIVPALWWYECTNVLLTTVRRNRLAAAQAREAMSALWRLPTHTRDASSPSDALHLFHLGLGHRLTGYDAAYLALAELTGATILTMDQQLKEAARELDIPVAPS